MKSILTFLSLVMIVFISACSSDEDPKKVSETPLATLVENNPAFEFELYDPYSYGLGYEFKALGNANVTALGCASPVEGTYNVQLYLVDTLNNTGTLMAETEVTIGASDIETVTFIFSKLSNKVSITKNNYYRVMYSETTTSFYRLAQQDGFSLPFVSDQKKIKVIQGVYGDVDSYPSSTNTLLYTADVQLEYTK